MEPYIHLSTPRSSHWPVLGKSAKHIGELKLDTHITGSLINYDIMPRFHLHEYLCEWPCDHEIKQYSYEYVICQEFSIYFLL